MGEKGDPTEVIAQLRQVAASKPPGVREQIMGVLNDYQTVRTVLDREDDEDDEKGTTEGEEPSPPTP